ncbi:hypothetical protein BELL_1205g00010 [Botrytis elliptica]|uniref:Uncharacterized protein n=1 Tax=Botrytis elliptica TaxID=278938 RepID=A0A4Z1IGA0_9HELO|nr:hypothetical protein BELL_1205g00010 [Botrytis elliptica]
MEPIETSFRKSVEREFTDMFEFAKVDGRIPANQRVSSGRADCIIGKIADTTGVANAAGGAWRPMQQMLLVSEILNLKFKLHGDCCHNDCCPVSLYNGAPVEQIQSVGGPSHNEIGTWKGALAKTCCMQGHYNQLGRNQFPGSQLHVFAELWGMLIGRAKRFFGGTEMTVQGYQIDTAI